MKEYKVKFLSNFEYNQLPFKYAKDSVGCANPATKTAYVRKSEVPLMDQFVLAHEISELVEKNSSHADEENIRYKKGGAARSFLPMLLGTIGGSLLGMPWLGAAIGGASNIGMDQYAKANHPEQLGQPGQIGDILGAGALGGLGGYGGTTMATGAIKGATAAAPGFLSKASGALGGALGFAPTTTGATGATTGLGKEFAAQQASQFGTSIGQNTANFGNTLATGGAAGRGLTAITGAAAAGIPFASSLGFTPQTGTSAAAPTGTYNAANIPASPLGEFGKGSISNTLNASQASQGIGDVSAGVNATQTAASSPLKNLLKSLGIDTKTAVGAAIPMVGQFFSPGTQAFNANESQLFQDVSERVKLGTQVQLTDAQKQSITDQYDTALENARQNIMDRYKGLRPGSDISNDSQLREALTELESDVATQKANALAGATMGLTQQQTQMMSELANLEIGTLAMKAGISNQEASQFQQMLSNLGFLVATSGNRVYTQ